MRISKTCKVDEEGVPIIDQPLLSPSRILKAICRWAYLTVHGQDLSLLEFIIYSGRPYKSHKKGKY